MVNAQSYDSGVCTRHYEISRILRYRLSSSSPSARRRLRLGITMLTRYPRLDFLNPPPFGAGFGPFVAFDRGRSTPHQLHEAVRDAAQRLNHIDNAFT